MASGSHARAKRGGGFSRMVVTFLALVVVAAAVGGLGYLIAERVGAPASGDEASGSCRTENVAVSVAPRIEQVVRPALDTLTTDCLTFTVEPATEWEAVDAVFFGGEVPDLWIPDGDWGLEKMPVDVVSLGLASTPVLLVGGPDAPVARTWAEALSTGVVAMPDPLQDSVGALTMLAPVQEAAATGGDPEAAKAFLVPMAQRHGELAAEGASVDLSLDSITATTTRVVAATEAEFLAALQTNRSLRSVTPETGTERVVFPLAVGKDADAAAREAAQALAAWFESDEGRAAVREAGLRERDGGPIADGAGAGRLTYLPSPQSTEVDAHRLTWQVMSVPSSVLAVVDVSGSMDFDTPEGGTRIDVAVGAAQVALDVFPGHARVGLWVFSIDRGGPGQDWRVLEPVRRLDDEVGGRTQRELLAARAQEMTAMTTGGTGLNDTALAAYRQAVRDYDPNYSNSMILLTDGANDDPGSIGEADLLLSLKALVDPQRPVRIIGVAISQDADLQALRRIAEATGGRAHRADTPEDILTVFSSEIAAR